MNWSTRLRRWVRISTPPVRVASMKPTAATVLPAPVACSNQKRRSAPGIVGRLLDHLLLVLGRLLLPVLGLLVGRQLLILFVEIVLVLSAVLLSVSLGRLLGRRRLLRRRHRAVLFALPLASSPIATCCSAISSVSVPESASTWCGFSSAPSRSFGGSSASRRSRPRSREKSRRHWIEGSSAPSSSSVSAASRARRRAVPGASASGPSPSRRKGSRANFAARSISALDGTAAGAATSLVLAMKAFGFVPAANGWRAGALRRGCRESVLMPPPSALTSGSHKAANRTYVL